MVRSAILFLSLMSVMISTVACLNLRNYSAIFVVETEGQEVEVRSSLSQSVNAVVEEVCVQSLRLFDVCVQCLSSIRLLNLLDKTKEVDVRRLFDVVHLQSSLEHLLQRQQHNDSIVKLLLVGNLELFSVRDSFFLLPEKSVVHWMTTAIVTEQDMDYLRRCAAELDIAFETVQFGSVVRHISDNLIDGRELVTVIVRLVD